MRRREIEQRLRALEAPTPSAALRERVLRHAARRIDVPRPRAVDRIWFSSRWRLAWAAAIVLLLIVEAVADGRSVRRSIESHLAAVATESPELISDLDLPAGWRAASLVRKQRDDRAEEEPLRWIRQLERR